MVDLDALGFNLRNIRTHCGVPVMGIVKANAYGHGLVPVARHLQAQGVEQLGVAFVEEGVTLRRAGITTPILVLGGMFGPQVAQFIAHDLEITVSSLDKLRQVEAAAQALGRKATIHIKVDTGMERIGVHSYSAKPFIEAAVASQWCVLKGIYSHLACADDPASPMTSQQLERFLETCAHIERIGAPMPLRHLANSGGVLHFPQTHLDMVRPGILLYGVLPDPSSQRNGRREAGALPGLAGGVLQGGQGGTSGQLRRHLGALAGHARGHDSDRLRRWLSAGIVLARAGVDPWPAISRRRARVHGPVHGRYWTSGTAYNEDEVVLIGKQGNAAVSAEAVAQAAGTIPYEILTGLNERIPREYRGG